MKFEKYIYNFAITYHRACRHCVPFQPEGDKRRCHQNNARNEDRRKVKGAITREYQINLKAAVVSCVSFIFCCLSI